MNTQTDLARTPAARATDASSSHAAAEAITASGERGRQQRVVLAMVTLWPGRTSAELSRYAHEQGHRLSAAVNGAAGTQHQRDRCRLDRWQVARRLSELEPTHIERGAQRKCAVGIRKALTWWPV